MHSLEHTLRTGAPLEMARGALILLHGRGSSADDIIGLAQALDAAQFACLAPEAEGGVWYPQRFFVPLANNQPWLDSALQTVDALVGRVVAAGIPAERIGLIGFSQGGCLALEHTMRAGRRYGFAAGLSAALIGPLDTPRPARDLQGTPVLLGCAELDAHIPREHVEHSATVFEKMDAAVTKQLYPGSAHTVFRPEIAWINEQLARIVG
jgi:phospholipase/carboxylesterase